MDSVVLISIIIPVYNTPMQCLNRLFDSILKQTSNNYKVLLVDDGSEKECAEYLDQVCVQNNQFHVLHNNHSGVSASRNLGIKKTETEYIAFSDADDTFACSFVEDATNYLLQYKPDIIYGTMEFVPWKDIIQNGGTIDAFNGKDIMEVRKALLKITPRKLRYTILGTPCARIYKTELAKMTLFRENLSFYEDQIFNREILRNSNRVLVVPNTWYYYFQNDFSAMHYKRKKNFYMMTKSYWDVYYELNKKESWDFQSCLRLYGLDFFYAVINNDYLTKEISLKEKIYNIKEIAKHPMISDAINNLKIMDNTLNNIQRINLLFLKFKWYRLLYLEKKLVYKLHMNTDL